MIKPTNPCDWRDGKDGERRRCGNAGCRVRAMVHRKDGRSERLKSIGVEVAVAEMSDVERVANALHDVQRAYYCPPLDPYAIQGAVAFTIAAREVRLEHIVGVTQWLASRRTHR